MKYRVRLTARAKADLKAIRDQRTQQSVIRELLDLQTQPDQPTRKMTGKLKDYYRVRAAGQTYRILYAVLDQKVLVLVVLIGARKEGSQEDVYVEAERRLKQSKAKQKPTSKPRKSKK